MRVADEKIFVKLAGMAKSPASFRIYAKSYAKWVKQGRQLNGKEVSAS